MFTWSSGEPCQASHVRQAMCSLGTSLGPHSFTFGTWTRGVLWWEHGPPGSLEHWMTPLGTATWSPPSRDMNAWEDGIEGQAGIVDMEQLLSVSRLHR